MEGWGNGGGMGLWWCTKDERISPTLEESEDGHIREHIRDAGLDI